MMRQNQNSYKNPRSPTTKKKRTGRRITSSHTTDSHTHTRQKTQTSLLRLLIISSSSSSDESNTITAEAVVTTFRRSVILPPELAIVYSAKCGVSARGGGVGNVPVASRDVGVDMRGKNDAHTPSPCFMRKTVCSPANRTPLKYCRADYYCKCMACCTHTTQKKGTHDANS